MYRFMPTINFKESIKVGRWYVLFEDEDVILIFPDKSKMLEFYDLISNCIGGDNYESESSTKR